MSRTAKKDALEDFDFLNELEGWSPNEMARTVGKLFKGADKIARAIIAETDTEPLDPARIRNICMAMDSIARSIERFTGVYSFATAQGNMGKNSAAASALEDLLPLLQPTEIRQLQLWLARLETYQKTR